MKKMKTETLPIFIPFLICVECADLLVAPFSFLKNIKLGEQVRVFCTVRRGDPPFSFSWWKDGEELYVGPHFDIEQIDEYTSRLVVRGVSAYVNGYYTCRASNTVASDNATAQLFVEEWKARKVSNITQNITNTRPSYPYWSLNSCLRMLLDVTLRHQEWR
ncbi:cell adhesion molecule Dscam2-like [Tachypleus tridentatus]|uniref:cell adhesion molecule Dscam2-like n=1 Tax=Tachypleus tridentatus TaxID=6853 RepID=UPI003FD5F072